MKKTIIFSYLFLAAAFTSQAFGDDFVSAGGKAATPTKYEPTITNIEMYNGSTGAYVQIFSGASQSNIASVLPGGVVGTLGQGVSLPAGTYSKIRVTMHRKFNINAEATSVGPGPAATCSTGGTTSVKLGDYTVDIVTRNGTKADQIFTIPSEADQRLINAGMEVLNANDIRITYEHNSFTVLPNATTLPAGISVKFDVTNSVQFLSDATQCYGIVLPPTVTITTPGGSKTFSCAI